MKTEMEQLKENTQRQYAKERVEELVQRMEEARLEWRHNLRWKLRTTNLQLLNITCFWIGLVYSAIQDAPEEIVASANYWFMLLFALLLMREHYFDRYAQYAEGVLDGIIMALETLYPQDSQGDGEVRKKVKKVSLFKRFKEFFERIGEGKTKEVPA